MFVVIPPKKEVNITPKIKSKDYYVIKPGFTHPLEQCVNTAIDYYYQKYVIFMQAAEQMVINNFTATTGSIPSFQGMFANAVSQFNSQAIPTWQEIQKYATTDAQLQSNIAELNKITQQAKQAGNKVIATADVLRALGITSNGSPSVNLPGTINIDFLLAQLPKLMDPKASTRSLGGRRANVFGEIFEQASISALSDGIGGLVKTFQIGAKQALGPSGLKQGKSDGLISLFGSLVDTNVYQGKNLVGNLTTLNHIELDAYELFDLEAQSPFAYLGRHNPRSSMAGISIKAWVKPSSMGSFARTAAMINNRQPSGIAEYFLNGEEFKAYNAYIVSKYLTNIIGVYNALMVTGESGFIQTYQWLYDIYNNQRVLAHGYSGNDSTILSYADRGRAKDSSGNVVKSYTGSKQDIAHGEKYKVRNNIAIQRLNL